MYSLIRDNLQLVVKVYVIDPCREVCVSLMFHESI